MENPDSFGTSEAELKKAKSYRAMKIIWTILIAVFSVIIVIRLYEWSQGKDNFRGILAPIGLVFVGAGVLVRRRNPVMGNILSGIAIVIVLTALVLMLIY